MGIKKACAYCGKPSNKRDREHVFPKNLYPPSKANSKIQLLTIPACRKCNNSWSDDEAHFRNTLVIAGDPTTSEKKELWEDTINRSFFKVDGLKRRNDLIVHLKQVRIDGQIRFKIYPANDPRVIRIVRKIIRGLCFHHISISPIHDERIFVDVLKYQIPEEFIAQMEYHDRDRDIVEYYYKVLNEDEIHSVWIITFYRTVTFLSGKVNSDKKMGKVKVVDLAYEKASHRQTEGPNRTGNIQRRAPDFANRIAIWYPPKSVVQVEGPGTGRAASIVRR
jgi:hypothetical protein